jgi:hypothetical protein
MRLAIKLFFVILVLYTLSILFAPPLKAGCYFDSRNRCTGTCSCQCGGICYCGERSGSCVALGCNTNCCYYNCRKYSCNSNEDQVSGYCTGTDMVCCRPKPRPTNTPTPRPTNTPTPRPTNTPTPRPPGCEYDCKNSCNSNEVAVSGYCPGNGVVCCRPKPTNTPTPRPTNTPTPQPPRCEYNCKDSCNFNEVAVSGYCPGNGVVCCRPKPTNTPTPRPTNTPIPQTQPTNTSNPRPQPTNTPIPQTQPTNTSNPRPQPTNTPIPQTQPTNTSNPRPQPTNTPIPQTQPTNTSNPTFNSVIGLNRFRLLDGSQYNSPPTLIVDNNLQTQKSQTLYAGLITRNWPSAIVGKTQWNDIFLSNPNNTSANVTIKVYSAHNGAGKTNGQLLATIQKNIPPYGWFNTYGDNDWNNLPDNYDAAGIQTLAWAEITSDKLIIGMNRFRLLDGSQYNSPPTLIVDNNLQTQKSQTLYAGLITRNWPSAIVGKTQWNDIFLSNPNNTSANVTIKVYSAHNGAGKTNGQLLATIQKNIPPYGWFNTYGDNDWNNLPDNYDAAGIQTLAWAEITSDKLIIGMNRFRLLDGSQYNSPPTLIVDNNLQTQKSQTLYAGLITRNWPSAIVGKTQWNDIFLSNPNNTSANVTIKVYSAHNGAGKTNGQLLATIQKNIPPYGWFNTYGDNDWNNLPDNYDAAGIQTLAWAEITSDKLIIGMNRFRLLDGSQYNSPPTLIVDNNLQTQKSQTLYAGLITRNWPSAIVGKTQWNDIFLSNPNNTSANVTIKVYSAHNGAGKTNGQLLATIQKNIPPYGWFNTYGDNDWNNLPDNYDAAGIQTLAWVEINSFGSTFTPTPTRTPTPTSPQDQPTNTPTFTPAPTLTPACAKKTLGDANCDEKIDGIDYSMWLNRQCNSGCSAENLKADFNLDNKVNDDDYSIWFNNRQ